MSGLFLFWWFLRHQQVVATGIHERPHGCNKFKANCVCTTLGKSWKSSDTVSGLNWRHYAVHCLSVYVIQEAILICEPLPARHTFMYMCPREHEMTYRIQ